MESATLNSHAPQTQIDSSLAFFLQQHPDGAYVKDLFGRTVLANPNVPAIEGLHIVLWPIEEQVRNSGQAKTEIEVELSNQNGEKCIFVVTCLLWQVGEEILGTITTLRDITQSRKNEIELTESTNLMQLVLEHLPVRVFWKDKDLVYLGMNTIFANDMGFDAADALIGHDDYHTNMTREEADICRADDFFVLDTGEARYGAEEIIRSEEADDGISWIRVSKVPLHNASGDMIGVLGMYEDVGEQKRAQIELENALRNERELNELKTRFISTVSHEYRNPLAIIQSSTDALHYIGHKLDEGKKLAYFGAINSAVKKMTQLLEDVLFIGREDLQTTARAYEAVNMEMLVKEVITHYSDTDQARIELQAINKQRPIIGIPLYLSQIVQNLITNALKYSQDTVHVSLSWGDETVNLTVKDQGMGIPIKDQPRIFSSFFRSENVGQIQGHGLGLHIVKRVVDIHQGQIRFTSQPQNGSTFEVNLPNRQKKFA